jgi:hypothetical protein
MNGTFVSRHSISGLVALTLALVCVTPSDAWAYIDPGSGSYLFQLGAAAVLASLYTVRRQWYALVSALRGRTVRANDPAIPAQRANDVE